MKQQQYKVGIYVRLSKDDERAGESLSIENQKLILRKYVEEQGWTEVESYIDDGYSGVSFERPAVKRLIEDAENGKINLIICKDLSRFGRNYIQLGQYIDYIFPMNNIRFIALSDNIDTLDKDSSAMDMMPIVNIFNEWHSAATSKKIKAVYKANAEKGKNMAPKAPYGYLRGDDENHTLLINEETAPIVRRIFEMYSIGNAPLTIAKTLNEDGILCPSEYHYQKFGTFRHANCNRFWSREGVKKMLINPAYIGNLSQMRSTTVSFKNRKTVHNNEKDWVVIENAHEAIISLELWEKCMEVKRRTATGKSQKGDRTMPLSGLMRCADCNTTMKLNMNNTTNGSKKNPRLYMRHNYTCGSYARSGKMACASHYIRLDEITQIILNDIRAKATLVLDNEKKARLLFIKNKADVSDKQINLDKKELSKSEKRIVQLNGLIQNVYEDKIIGKIPENVCINLLEKYQDEQKNLTERVAELKISLEQKSQDERDVDEFIRRIKRYSEVEELDRAMAIELIERIMIGDRDVEEREIHIYYKLLGNFAQ